MAKQLQKITYYSNKEKKTIETKICDTTLKKFSGLMFKKNSPPLFFPFKKTTNLSIHSLFCKPFTAIFLDDKMNAIKIVEVKTWKLNISAKAKYLLEIPLSPSTSNN